jgi:hypothetical protein
MKRTLTLLTFLAISTFASESKSEENEFGANLGWGNPFGISLQYIRNIETDQKIGMGIGLSAAGIKSGVDYKFLLGDGPKMYPYAGIALSYALGLSEMNVSVNTDSAKYQIKGGLAVTPRTGFCYKAGFANWYVNLGYGFPITGGGAQYISGSRAKNVEDFSKALEIGGFEISTSLMWRF